MIARVRVVVEVPYESELDVAAEHAETVILDQVKAEVSASGTVLDDLCMVEEVRQA